MIKLPFEPIFVILVYKTSLRSSTPSSYVRSSPKYSKPSVFTSLTALGRPRGSHTSHFHTQHLYLCLRYVASGVGVKIKQYCFSTCFAPHCSLMCSYLILGENDSIS